MRVVKPVEFTGINVFHDEEWEKTIRPEVMKAFTDPKPNQEARWLKEIGVVKQRLWNALPDEKRLAYERQAREFNEGTASKEIKAKSVFLFTHHYCSEGYISNRYGDKYFEEELNKAISSLGKLFGARIVAVSVRHGTDGLMTTV